MSDILATVKAALDHIGPKPTRRGKYSDPCAKYGHKVLQFIYLPRFAMHWLRALVVEVERLQSEVAVMAAGTSHDCGVIADGAETEEQLRADLMGQLDAYDIPLDRANALERENAALRQRHADTQANLDHAYLVLAHARKQENANGFQRGWHAALSRVSEGDTWADLAALVPQPAAHVEEPVCPADKEWVDTYWDSV